LQAVMTEEPAEPANEMESIAEILRRHVETERDYANYWKHSLDRKLEERHIVNAEGSPHRSSYRNNPADFEDRLLALERPMDSLENDVKGLKQGIQLLLNRFSGKAPN
jgi:hypothetical protein